MSKSTTPRTDGNKHALDHLERYGFENSLDDPVVEWPILCEEIERELAEAKEQRDRLAEALERIAEGSSCCACRGSAELAAIALEALAAVKGGTHDS